jgi:hypothetical protein
MNDIMKSYLQKQKREQRIELIISVLMLIGILSSLASIAFLQATQEAAAFNCLTNGPKVAAMDALWLDLRVEANNCPN